MPDMLIQILTTLIALATPYAIQWLKTEPWMPLLRPQMPILNAIVAGVIVVGQTLGLSFAFTEGTLTISGLTMPAIVLAGFNWVVQEVTYRLTLKRS